MTTFLDDQVEVIILLRNALAHGNSEIHPPGMALRTLELCAWGIDTVFPLQIAADGA